MSSSSLVGFWYEFCLEKEVNLAQNAIQNANKVNKVIKLIKTEEMDFEFWPDVIYCLSNFKYYKQ